jgi:hypothetical protein
VLASVLVASVAIACSGDLTVSMKAAGSSGTDDRPLVLVRALFFFFLFFAAATADVCFGALL